MPTLPAAVSAMDWGRFRIDVTEDGLTTTLGRDGEPWVTISLHGLVPQAGFVEDPDETEHAFDAGGARLAVRHSVGERWAARFALSNPTLAPLPAVLQIGVTRGAGLACWVWAAGAEGSLLVAPEAARGPVVSIALRLGALCSDGEGFSLTPPGLTLEPGARYVASLTASQHAELAEVASAWPAWLPGLSVPVGQVVRFSAPDWAVIAPQEWRREEPDGVVELSPPPGTHPVAVHSPRGVTHLELHAAPSLEAALASRASALVQAGEAPNPAQAVILVEAIGRSLVSAPRLAERMLQLTPRAGGLLAAAARAAMGLRQGRNELVVQALDDLAVAPVQPGFGRVVMRAWLAGLALGLSAQASAGELLARGADDALAAFELNLLTFRSAEGAAPMVAGLINLLGGSLPGQAWGRTDLHCAHAAGLLELCPEEWPSAASASEAAAKTKRRLLAGLVRQPDDEVLAWLAIDAALS